VVPLFLAPGLLLDQIAREAREIEAEVALPLGTALAELVLQRYLEALAVMPA
jgi:sirohydrochlorin ferrochelatase